MGILGYFSYIYDQFRQKQVSLITIADATQGFSTFKPGKNMIQPGTTFSLAVRQNLVSSSVNLSSQDLAGMGKSEELEKMQTRCR